MMNTAQLVATDDIDELDQYLYQTLLFLFEKWYLKDVGIVACCLKDGDKITYATSTRQNDFWLHAERNAYLKFQDKFGEPSHNSIFIVTLSPCLKELKRRDQASCSELIKNLGIRKVHFGVLDTLHVSTLADYNLFGLTATLSKNKNLHEMCMKLMGIFSTYDSRINKELLLIKQKIGDGFFDSLILNDDSKFKKLAVK